MANPMCSLCFQQKRTKWYKLEPGSQLWNIVLLENTDKKFSPESRICKTCYQEIHKKTGITQNPLEEWNKHHAISLASHPPPPPHPPWPGFNAIQRAFGISPQIPGFRWPTQPAVWRPPRLPQFITLKDIANPDPPPLPFFPGLYYQTLQPPSNQGPPAVSCIQVKATPASGFKCFLCNDASCLRPVTNAMRRQVWQAHQIHIAFINQICSSHLQTPDGQLTDDAVLFISRNTGILSMPQTDFAKYIAIIFG